MFSFISNALVQKGYAVIDNFLAPDSVQLLQKTIMSFSEQGQFKRAKIGAKAVENLNDTIRGDTIYWLDEDPTHPGITAYFSAINHLIQMLNRSLFLGLSELETHMAIYPSGSFYKKHVDQFKGTQKRRISCVYYLNKDWQTEDGGELCLYDADNNIIDTLLPHENRFICFESHLPHEVLTTHKTRYSITGWLKTT